MGWDTRSCLSLGRCSLKDQISAPFPLQACTDLSYLFCMNTLQHPCRALLVRDGPGTCSLRGVLREGCTHWGSHSPSRREDFLWLDWSLVILVHVLQPTYPLCSKTAPTEASVSGQSPCHPKSLALGSPLGMCHAQEWSVFSKSSVQCWACSG